MGGWWYNRDPLVIGRLIIDSITQMVEAASSTKRMIAGHEGSRIRHPWRLLLFLSLLWGGAVGLTAEIHHYLPATRRLALDLTPGPQLVRGPYLQMGTPTSIVVRWRTSEPTDSLVQCGTSLDDLSLGFSVAALTNEHQVELTGLQPDTKFIPSACKSKPNEPQTNANEPYASPVKKRPIRRILEPPMQPGQRRRHADLGGMEI